MKKKISILLIFVFLLTAGAACKSPSVEEATEPITLNYWRVYDGQDDFADC